MSDPPPFERLLSLQEHDTHVEQLEHRRAAIPERADLATTEASLGRLEAEARAVQSKLDGVGRDQRRREDEVAALESKAKEISDAMYGGRVTSPRELQTMQEEIDSLRRHLSSVEDEIIELMEYAEPLQASVVQLAARRTVLDEAAQASLAKIAEQEAVIDAELAVVRAERSELAANITPDVVDMYDNLQKSLGGVAVARLEHGTCGGCHLALPAAELDRIRHLAPDAIVHCEECGRLLVH